MYSAAAAAADTSLLLLLQAAGCAAGQRGQWLELQHGQVARRGQQGRLHGQHGARIGLTVHQQWR
jgi:hypothetical protein